MNSEFELLEAIFRHLPENFKTNLKCALQRLTPGQTGSNIYDSEHFSEICELFILEQFYRLEEIEPLTEDIINNIIQKNCHNLHAAIGFLLEVSDNSSPQDITKALENHFQSNINVNEPVDEAMQPIAKNVREAIYLHLSSQQPS